MLVKVSNHIKLSKKVGNLKACITLRNQVIETMVCQPRDREQEALLSKLCLDNKVDWAILDSLLAKN